MNTKILLHSLYYFMEYLSPRTDFILIDYYKHFQALALHYRHLSKVSWCLNIHFHLHSEINRNYKLWPHTPHHPHQLISQYVIPLPCHHPAILCRAQPSLVSAGGAQPSHSERYRGRVFRAAYIATETGGASITATHTRHCTTADTVMSGCLQLIRSTVGLLWSYHVCLSATNISSTVGLL